MKSMFSLFSIDINRWNDKTEWKLNSSDKFEREKKAPKIMKSGRLFVWFRDKRILKYWNSLQDKIPSVSQPHYLENR